MFFPIADDSHSLEALVPDEAVDKLCVGAGQFARAIIGDRAVGGPARHVV